MSAPAVTAPFLAATVVLGVAGLAKLRRPDDTARALIAASIPLGRTGVRAGALAEIAVAVAAIAVPSAITGALVAASYAGFAVFVAMALHQGWPLASCGCFGRPDTAPHRAHAVLNVGAAAAAVWWAAVAPDHIGSLFHHETANGVPLMLITATLAGLAYLVWTNPLAVAER
jgi:Methylamine utilisation protein MauE